MVTNGKNVELVVTKEFKHTKELCKEERKKPS